MGEASFVAAGSLLSYKIEFENYEEATAPAQRVDISDQLSPSFDWSTLELTSVGFGDIVLTIPPRQQFYRTTVDYAFNGYSFDVEIEIGLRAATGELYARFISIDPNSQLPPPAFTGFLPQEDGTGRGQGFFTYIIRPRTDLPTGTGITNIAMITFDRGQTIATDQVDPLDPSKGTDPAKRALVTIDADPPNSAVAQLPTTVSRDFIVRWGGDDPGSGIGHFDVFVSINDGPFTEWLSDTPLTEAEFPDAISDNTYAFYSIATDNVGYREQKTPTAEATTRVVVGSPWQNATTPNDVNADLIVSPIDVLLIINYLNSDAPTSLRESTWVAPPYLDVNGDELVSPIDVLLVINHLNANSSSGAAEGEQALPTQPVSDSTPFPAGLPLLTESQPWLFRSSTYDADGPWPSNSTSVASTAAPRLNASTLSEVWLQAFATLSDEENFDDDEDDEEQLLTLLGQERRSAWWM